MEQENKLKDFFPRTTSTVGKEFIKKRESFRSKPYLDGKKVPTIGFGNTYYPDGTKVTMNDAPISAEKGLELFEVTLKTFEKGVNSAIIRPISQNEFDALVSLAYNIGVPRFKTSSVVKRINGNTPRKEVADAFRMWKLLDGEVSQGLVNRREEEIKLFLGK
jgi:lysozyme